MAMLETSAADNYATAANATAANALAALEFTLYEFDDGTVGLCADLGNIHFPAQRLLDGILDRDGGWPLPCLKQGAFGSWESFRAIPATM